MDKADVLTISNDRGQRRDVSWSEFCFIFVGSKNRDEINRIAAELTANGRSHWIAPADGVRVDIELQRA
ncbi:hypothetical protein [Rhizobium sp. BK491]|uniref:hypothetical protein n=1 Tax=Rhizobium sp. BK491 TaxID=2587009 RepID=UPI001613A522|nr:hypothetical protein [Rhizobium sp. BK491]MBB3567251.1 hypothetical protein [Rhizobium sp. BK491]